MNILKRSLAKWVSPGVVALMLAGSNPSLSKEFDTSAVAVAAPIPVDQLGAIAGKQYQGDGLSVTTTPDGACLRCVLQRLDGQVTAEGLWLVSTAEGRAEERLRVVASAIGREGGPTAALPQFGKVGVAGELARFIRPGLTEEYSVSVEGVRQDFLIAERPAGRGDLRVELTLTGTQAEAAPYGIKLTFAESRRALAYGRLKVTDATGRHLPARIEVLSIGRLTVWVTDVNANYPLRIDPTFSDADWVSLNPGIPGTDSFVQAVAVDENGNLYVGGGFGLAGSVSARHIARWDGNAWAALGAGLDDNVRALVASGTNLYAGGNFGVARWDGSSWTTFGPGVNLPIYALAVSGTNLYAGGGLFYCDGAPSWGVARWDGTTWSGLGSGMNANGNVNALLAVGNDLYAAGNFRSAGGVAATNVARWNGTTWSAMGPGISSSVDALAAQGTNLFAGGGFGVVKWDGSTWPNIGSGVAGRIFALAAIGNDLYAGGEFPFAGGSWGVGIAKWDGSTWSNLGSGLRGGSADAGYAYGLAASGTNLYVGGYFSTAGGVPANYLAKWSGGGWSALGSGIGGAVRALAMNGTDLYIAGGLAATSGDQTPSRIIKWNGSNWSDLGSGMNGPVYSLAVSGTNVYAGGDFSTADGVPAMDVAKWNGSGWTAIGSGISGESEWVGRLAFIGETLYVGGYFSSAGGVAAANIAEWDGNAWSAVGSGVGDGAVIALAAMGSDLYAGGNFTTAGGGAARNVAKWNGNEWSALGSGVGDDIEGVHALAVEGSNLYAGGHFSRAGDVTVTNVARWDGNSWSALGSGLNDTVRALAVSGTNLYAGGGYFTGVGVSPITHIAKWDGNAWSDLASGVDSFVFALAADGAGHLFVGGDFFTAGTNVSPFIAKANIGAGVAGGRLTGLTYSPITGFSCTFGDATLGQSYRIQSSPTLAGGSWTDLTNFTYTGPVLVEDHPTLAETNKFYRAITP